MTKATAILTIDWWITSINTTLISIASLLISCPNLLLRAYWLTGTWYPQTLTMPQAGLTARCICCRSTHLLRRYGADWFKRSIPYKARIGMSLVIGIMFYGKCLRVFKSKCKMIAWGDMKCLQGLLVTHASLKFAYKVRHFPPIYKILLQLVTLHSIHTIARIEETSVRLRKRSRARRGQGSTVRWASWDHLCGQM